MTNGVRADLDVLVLRGLLQLLAGHDPHTGPRLKPRVRLPEKPRTHVQGRRHAERREHAREDGRVVLATVVERQGADAARRGSASYLADELGGRQEPVAALTQARDGLAKLV